MKNLRSIAPNCSRDSVDKVARAVVPVQRRVASKAVVAGTVAPDRHSVAPTEPLDGITEKAPDSGLWQYS